MNTQEHKISKQGLLTGFDANEVISDETREGRVVSIVSHSRYFRKVVVSRFGYGVGWFDSILINENFSVSPQTKQ